MHNNDRKVVPIGTQKELKERRITRDNNRVKKGVARTTAVLLACNFICEKREGCKLFQNFKNNANFAGVGPSSVPETTEDILTLFADECVEDDLQNRINDMRGAIISNAVQGPIEEILRCEEFSQIVATELEWLKPYIHD